MDKRNYQDSLEEDRQEIITDSNPTQSRRTQRKIETPKPKKRKNILLPSLFFIFILIPVSILIYVAFFYEPNDTLIEAGNENEVSVENASPPTESSVIVPEEAEEETVEPEEQEPAEVEETEETEEKTSESVTEEAPEATEQPEENNEPAEQEQPAPAPSPAPVTPSTPEAEEPAPAATDSSNAETVVVKANETLYRIAVNNYGASGAGAAVEKIKQANGLSSNEIYVGQTLILP